MADKFQRRHSHLPSLGHSHSHSHGHEHSHDHEHSHEHAHQHEHSHEHAHEHSHDHAHGHEHAHSHGHEHSHDHELLPTANAEIRRGEGVGKTLLLDTPSGISGDMTVAALVDLGIPFGVVRDAIELLGLGGVRLGISPARSGAIGGSRFTVDIHGEQPERTYSDIDRMIAGSRLDEPTQRLARRIFRRLAEAESEVHRMPLAEVAFHEVGAADSIVDIVGAAACFAYLGARVIATALPLGRGFVDCEHGRLPLPAPATLLCLKGVPTYDSGLEQELVTPTGAAIVATVAEEFVRWPALAPERVGFGCGTRRLADRPNGLRLVLGLAPEQSKPALASHVLLEANVDDMTGELAGHALEALLGAGALDAWASPVTMKKGRPGLVISAVTADARADAVTEAMLRETSSIGVRRLPVSRTERPRRMVEVTTAYGVIPIKVSEGAFGPPQIKPEFDACVRAAQSAQVPVRQVIAAALRAYDELGRAP